MLYHFGTRNLSFLKSTTLLNVLRGLAEHPTARAACTAAGVSEPELPVYGRALAALAGSSMIVSREPAAARGIGPVSPIRVAHSRAARPGLVTAGPRGT